MEKLYDLEFAINDWIASHLRSPILDPIMHALSFLGEVGWFFILVAVIFLCFKKTRRFGVAMAISLILSTLATNVILKPLIARPRPYEMRSIEGLDKVLMPSDASFPSGHTTVSFSAAFSLFWQDKKYGAPMLALAVLISFSRLYFYLHFPTDVLGGVVVGLLASLASKALTPPSMKGLDSLATFIRNKRIVGDEKEEKKD